MTHAHDLTETALSQWLDHTVATLPMLRVDRPAVPGQHRARRRYMQRRRPVWRDAFRALGRSVLSAPDATAWVVSAAVLVGMAIGASS